jgi:Fuc2NAc and GlcNAc transferase
MALFTVSVAAAGAIAWLLTGIVRRYALSRGLVDVPNHRSSHSAPTPRGGGVTIATIALLATGVLSLSGLLAPTTGLALFLGGGAVATVGWLDDHCHVPARWRLVAHLIAAAWATYWIGVPESLWLGPWSLDLGPFGFVLAVLGLAWVTNLFNFMDGIDGLAGAEAVAVAAVGGALLLLAGATGLGVLALLTAAATAGFLVWNWPPARIFMGDVGSGLLGFLLGGMALAGAAERAVPLSIWAILLAIFLFDATATLVRRVAAGERFFEAHRRHAYQRAVQAGYSHQQVTASVLLLNGVLTALAIVAWQWASTVPFAVAAALLLVAIGYLTVERIRPMWQEPPEGTGGVGNGTEARYRKRNRFVTRTTKG